MKKLLLCITAAFGLVLSGCESDGDKPPKPAPETKEVTVPAFNADSAFAFVKRQVDFGPRVPNTEAHMQCGNWLVAKLRGYGAQVTEQQWDAKAWDGKVLKARNIIAEINPAEKKRVLLCAHWDTRPWADKDTLEKNWRKPLDGANDGASGVAVLLELARQMHEAPLTLGVDIILFDVEDYGKPEFAQPDYEKMDYEKANAALQADNLTWCLGSQYWGGHLHRPNYKARFGILLDMVGARDAVFTKEGHSMYYAPHVVNKVWRAASKLGFSAYFSDELSPAITDDHVYVNDLAGIPTIDIVHFAQGPKTMGMGNYQFGFFHHTLRDNLEIIDPATLKAVGQTLLYVTYHEQ